MIPFIFDGGETMRDGNAHLSGEKRKEEKKGGGGTFRRQATMANHADQHSTALQPRPSGDRTTVHGRATRHGEGSPKCEPKKDLSS
jgi:hypothetical protein